MERKNKIIFIIVLIATLCVISFLIYRLVNNNIKKSDAYKFVNEYMSLNDKINEFTSKEYENVIISEKNTVKYVNEDEVLDLLDDGIGLIYFGYATNSDCRLIVPSLVDIANKNEMPVYYLDISEIRSTFELKDNKVTKINEASEGYLNIVKKLDKVLDDFYLEDEDGNRYIMDEKRIVAPTIIAIKDGKIKDIYTNTLINSDNLNGVIYKLINSIKNDNCTVDSKC